MQFINYFVKWEASVYLSVVLSVSSAIFSSVEFLFVKAIKSSILPIALDIWISFLRHSSPWRRETNTTYTMFAITYVSCPHSILHSIIRRHRRNKELLTNKQPFSMQLLFLHRNYLFRESFENTLFWYIRWAFNRKHVESSFSSFILLITTGTNSILKSLLANTFLRYG